MHMTHMHTYINTYKRTLCVCWSSAHTLYICMDIYSTHNSNLHLYSFIYKMNLEFIPIPIPYPSLSYHSLSTLHPCTHNSPPHSDCRPPYPSIPIPHYLPLTPHCPSLHPNASLPTPHLLLIPPASASPSLLATSLSIPSQSSPPYSSLLTPHLPPCSPPPYPSLPTPHLCQLSVCITAIPRGSFRGE